MVLPGSTKQVVPYFSSSVIASKEVWYSLLVRHSSLEGENVGKVRWAQVVGEYAPGGVGVTDVHVPIDKSGGNHHLAGVYNPVSGHFGHFLCLANPGYTLPFYQD